MIFKCALTQYRDKSNVPTPRQAGDKTGAKQKMRKSKKSISKSKSRNQSISSSRTKQDKRGRNFNALSTIRAQYGSRDVTPVAKKPKVPKLRRKLTDSSEVDFSSTLR